MGVLSGDSVVVESNREPPVEFVAGPSAWPARRPPEPVLRQTTDVLRPVLARIQNTKSQLYTLTPEEIKTLRSLGYVGGSSADGPGRQ